MDEFTKLQLTEIKRSIWDLVEILERMEKLLRTLVEQGRKE